jgi:hypothetical protein
VQHSFVAQLRINDTNSRRIPFEWCVGESVDYKGSYSMVCHLFFCHTNRAQDDAFIVNLMPEQCHPLNPDCLRNRH